MTTTLVLALALALVLPAHRAALADPLYCVVVYDQNGHPIDTVCVPGPR
jgi:hypothetical protein